MLTSREPSRRASSLGLGPKTRRRRGLIYPSIGYRCASAHVPAPPLTIERKLREAFPEIGQVFIEAQSFAADRIGNDAADA